MNRLAHVLLSTPSLEAVPVARVLVPIVTGETGLTTAGYPFLNPTGFARFRDTIPHVLGSGPRVSRAIDHLVELTDSLEHDEVPADERQSFDRAVRVVRTMLNTAAVAAPSDLWLLKHVLGTLAEVGITARLAAGETIDPDSEPGFDARELDTDLHFLLCRGYIAHVGGAYRITSHPLARAVLSGAAPISGLEIDPVSAWTRAFRGAELSDAEARHLEQSAEQTDSADPNEHRDTWWATPHEIELGYRLLPLILGMRVAGATKRLADETLFGDDLCPGTPRLASTVRGILRAAGVVGPGDPAMLTPIGRRVLSRGPGPMGIIGAYRPYLIHGVEILRQGTADVWVQRGANVAASQDANRATFRQANDALDALCADTGFAPTVFVEHAMGHGEATHQRWLRDPNMTFVGADLEDASIDAALAQLKAGKLPEGMLFVRRADIGVPRTLIEAMRKAGIETTDAVMMVGNGFHEVRGQTDGAMIEVFAGYEAAGFVLLFTEAAALSAADLLQTAFNTYNAGFQYVHARSGQGLRPATPGPTPRIGRPPPLSWAECAMRAGYVQAERYCRKSRTIYPYPPPSGHNPSISVNHFFVPRALAERLGLT